MSSPGDELGKHMDKVYISIEIAIAVASILGNVLIVLVVYVNQALRDTTFSFIVSLAVADIAVGSLVIPLAIVISLGFRTNFYTCLILSSVVLTITQSSILSLLAIAIDRYLRIKISTRYNDIVTQGRAYTAVCVCWILSILSGLVPLVGWNNLHSGNFSSSSEITCEFKTVIRMDYMVYFNFFVCVVIPLALMTILYGAIFRVIRQQLNLRAEATCDRERYYRKELKLAKSLVLVVFLFIICWMPIHIINCLDFFCSDIKIHKSVVYIGIVMSHINSALNPMVYAFRIKRFRVTLIQITRRCVLCKRTESSPCPSGTIEGKEKLGVNL